MASFQKKLVVKNCSIYEQDNKIFLEEISRDNVKIYDLNSLINKFSKEDDGNFDVIIQKNIEVKDLTQKNRGSVQ